VRSPDEVLTHLTSISREFPTLYPVLALVSMKSALYICWCVCESVLVHVGVCWCV